MTYPSWDELKEKARSKNPKLYEIYALIQRLFPNRYSEYLIEVVKKHNSGEGCESCYFRRNGVDRSKGGFQKGEISMFSRLSEKEICLYHMFNEHDLTKEEIKAVNGFIHSKPFHET